MKRILGVAAMLAVLGAVPAGIAGAAQSCLPQPCNGSCPILIQFDANCFAYETSYSTSTFISNPASHLTIVGLITQFGSSLSFLNANDHVTRRPRLPRGPPIRSAARWYRPPSRTGL